MLHSYLYSFLIHSSNGTHNTLFCHSKRFSISANLYRFCLVFVFLLNRYCVSSVTLIYKINLLFHIYNSVYLELRIPNSIAEQNSSKCQRKLPLNHREQSVDFDTIQNQRNDILSNLSCQLCLISLSTMLLVHTNSVLSSIDLTNWPSLKILQSYWLTLAYIRLHWLTVNWLLEA